MLVILNGLTAEFLKGWGVMWIVSSSSPPRITSSSSELSVSDSESIMFTLPIELERTDFSRFPFDDHKEFENIGEAGPELPGCPLRGMVTARPPTTGDESGEDLSANVE